MSSDYLRIFHCDTCGLATVLGRVDVLAADGSATVSTTAEDVVAAMGFAIARGRYREVHGMCSVCVADCYVSRETSEEGVGDGS